jgi:elongation factor Ts
VSVSKEAIKELRQRTDAPVMDCKRAFDEASGDLEAAIKIIQSASSKRAVKKAARVAAEGVVVTRVSEDATCAVILEVNSETDFVAKDSSFLSFVQQVVAVALAAKATDVEALSQLDVSSGETVEAARQTLVAKIGENIQLRRLHLVVANEGESLGSYTHGSKIGVVLAMKGGDDTLSKDIAMHIAALAPEVVSAEHVASDVVQEQKDMLSQQAAESGKPAEVVAKIVNGRLEKFLAEISLQGQAFVKDPSISVAQLLSQKQAQVVSFVRYKVGEGIEKEEQDFASEVMAQVHGSE